MNVLILGHTGMLGHMVLKYLKTKGVNVDTTNLDGHLKNLKIILKIIMVIIS